MLYKIYFPRRAPPSVQLLLVVLSFVPSVQERSSFAGLRRCCDGKIGDPDNGDAIVMVPERLSFAIMVMMMVMMMAIMMAMMMAKATKLTIYCLQVAGATALHLLSQPDA